MKSKVSQKRRIVLPVRLNEYEYEELDRLAQAEGRTRANLLRRWIASGGSTTLQPKASHDRNG